MIKKNSIDPQQRQIINTSYKYNYTKIIKNRLGFKYKKHDSNHGNSYCFKNLHISE
ncbi:hypothetical protein ET1_07_00420 [Edwardsiella tarda ATCC 15947 = NBRC 105688]|nr:hypothetical protein ET1_07_00420 [Edwardsiella tarda ATCC 15947 = NBRC 105688]